MQEAEPVAATQHPPQLDICRILWCGNGGSTISTAHPALEGSYCGNHKWCHEGRCQPWPSGVPPLVVHGRWSRWSNHDKCPVQHCQISGSVEVMPQHRDCTDPASHPCIRISSDNYRLLDVNLLYQRIEFIRKRVLVVVLCGLRRPNNGGLQCEGAAIRGILCSTHYSTCQGLSRKEYTNKICSSIKFDPVKPDQQLTGDGFEHSTQPCRVWCHLIGSELIRNKGQFPDGTPCGLDQFCISGICLKLGCDSKALVAGEDDCPDKNPRKRWSDWSTWSACSQSCGRNGRQSRKRSCLNSGGQTDCFVKFVIYRSLAFDKKQAQYY
ncbi:hypothetical protein RB195_024389 [Necator americanus]|uniref:ADAMTS cysteine-rich domain-containing protein n=1 Tax=Necator americanus TaxID=51031 RepID=A0ABR1EQA2_NECAM